jgi:hypothetical protein
MLFAIKIFSDAVAAETFTEVKLVDDTFVEIVLFATTVFAVTVGVITFTFAVIVFAIVLVETDVFAYKTFAETTGEFRLAFAYTVFETRTLVVAFPETNKFTVLIRPEETIVVRVFVKYACVENVELL